MRLTFRLAGVTFEGRQEKIRKYFKSPETVTFTREPDNKFDSNAIQIIGGEVQLGYVPGVIAESLAQLMDLGKKVTLISFEKMQSKNPEHAIGVEVTIEVDV